MSSRYCVSVSIASIFVLATVTRAQSAILYVDDDAAGADDGSSWTDAFTDLQAALAEAQDLGGPVVIRVGQGVYRPSGSGNRSIAFGLLNDVKLRGGFAGVGAPDPNDRNVAAYPTILSGDLNTDDQSGWVNYGENSFHVVSGDSTNASAHLDGFTVRGGNAWESSGPNSFGAGMRISNGSPTIKNCTFTLNISHLGAAITNLAGSPIVTNCTFIQNWAWIGRGGAVYNAEGSTPKFTDCDFISNLSYGASSVGDGGAMFNEFNAAPVLIGCVFYDNDSNAYEPNFANGGAICSLADGMLAINCAFLGNTALVAGGVWTGGNDTFINCIFSGNSSLAGGGMVGFTAALALHDCTFSKNHADDGGGLTLGWNSSANIRNSIFWGNTATNAPSDYKAQIHKMDDTATVDIQFSCVQGVFTPEEGEDPPDPNNFPGCTEANPQLVDANGPDNVDGTMDDDVHLQPGSPVIDAGKNGFVPADSQDLDGDANTTEKTPFDFDGAPRFVDDPDVTDTGVGTPPIVDMGACERQVPLPPGDINGDGVVDATDRDLFAGVLLGLDSDPEHVQRADLNGDGAADGDDAQWFVNAVMGG